MSRVLAASPAPQGVAGQSLGDGPYIDVGMFTADGNVNWNAEINSLSVGPYVYSAFSLSALGTAAQYSTRWWWRDFGPGGVWDIRVIHTLGFDVAIYHIEIDGRVVATIDGYTGGGDVNNVESTAGTGIRIEPGRHKVSITMRVHNPAASGIPWYPAIQGLIFRRTGPIPGGVAQPLPSGKAQIRGGQVISIYPCFATGNTNWDNYLATVQMMNQYELYSSGAQNAARWWDLDLTAGYWDVEIRCATFSSAGIISIQLDDTTVGTIDTYSAGTVYAVSKTTRILVPKTGLQRFKFLMATKNGSASQYYGDISLIQLRQVPSATPSRPHRIVHFPAFWSHGDGGPTGWNTLASGNSRPYGGLVTSGSGSQNNERWWYVPMTAGTWSVDLLHETGSNRGIYSVRIDDIEVGTIDGFGGSVSGVRSTVTGAVIRQTGYHKLSLVMASKNGSSSAYFGTIHLIGVRRTA